ncbi:MAG: hypothetical protein ACFFER_17115, partial [Candidatus Thorarchaeota archaeon]
MIQNLREFIKNAELFSPSYKSIRIRTLLADRGSGLEPSITVIHLLHSVKDESETILWNGKLLNVIEKIVKFDSISKLMSSLASGSVNIRGKRIGFLEDDEPYWDFAVILRGTTYNNYFADTTSLLLDGHVDVRESTQGYESQYRLEMQLNPQLQVSSLEELTEQLLGFPYRSINQNRLIIVAPSNTRLTHLYFHRNEVQAKISCTPDAEERLQFSAVFHHQDGSVTSFKPRRIGYTKSSIDNYFLEIEKSFEVPQEARDAISIDFTISLEGRLGIDSASARNLPISNPIWGVLNNLDVQKVSKYLSIENFENRLSLVRDSDLFESIVVSTVSSCGPIPIWTGGYKVSGTDMILIDINEKLV